MCDYACFLGYRHVVYEIAVCHTIIVKSAKIVILFVFAELFFDLADALGIVSSMVLHMVMFSER